MSGRNLPYVANLAGGSKTPTPTPDDGGILMFNNVVWITFVGAWIALNVVFMKHVLGNTTTLAALQTVNPTALGMLKFLFRKVWWSSILFFGTVQGLILFYQTLPLYKSDSTHRIKANRIICILSILLNMGIISIIGFQVLYLLKFSNVIDPSNPIFGTLVSYIMYEVFIGICMFLQSILFFLITFTK